VQAHTLFYSLAKVDWNQIAFTIMDEALGEAGQRAVDGLTSVFQILAQGGDLIADGMPPPRAAPEPPPCQDIFSVPSLMDFVMTNTDAGHIKTVAVKAADFAMRLSTTELSPPSSAILCGFSWLISRLSPLNRLT
jgi:hypothetical protein